MRSGPQLQRWYVAVGLTVTISAIGTGYLWYLRHRAEGEQLARWASLARGRDDGEALLKEIEQRRQQLRDSDAANDAAAYTYLGVAVGALGDKAAAIRFYEQGRRLDPTSRILLNNLANAHQDLQHWDEAERYYRQLIAAHPTYTAAYRLLGYLYRDRFGDPEEKIRSLFAGGLAATGNSPDLLSWLVSYYQERGEGEKAVPYAQQLAEQLNRAGQQQNVLDREPGELRIEF